MDRAWHIILLWMLIFLMIDYKHDAQTSHGLIGCYWRGLYDLPSHCGDADADH